MVREQDAIFLAAGSGKTSFVSAEDVAEVAAEAFARGGSGQEYCLTGPEALDHYEVARLIGSATGRSIAYEDVSEEVMLEEARAGGLPEGAVQYLAGLYRVVREDQLAEVSEDIRRVLGREPKSFREFVEAGRGAWE